MPTFAYTARDAAGKSLTGTLAAATIAEVGKLLRAEGKFPVEVTPAAASTAAKAKSPRGIKVSRAELIQFSNQLAIMVETGVQIADALDGIAQHETRKHVKALVQDLSALVSSGTDLSTALSRHPRSFPRLYIALIKASEQSGMMSKLLNRATNYLRDEQEIVRKVRGALTYPAIMFAFAMGTTIFLLAFVLPRFTAIYAAKAAALPAPTKVLMALSDALLNWWPVLVPAVVVGSVSMLLAVKKTVVGKQTLHWLQLNVPLLGGLFRQLNLARGLRMVGTMASSGVQLTECVIVARDLCDNTFFRRMWHDVESQIQGGKQLSDPLGKSNLVPKPISQMIRSAEKGGKVAQVMEQLATHAEGELKEKISELTRYIEPAMIVVMGFIIGGVSLALMLPIFTISKVMAS